jgi:hypothetical protein
MTNNIVLLYSDKSWEFEFPEFVQWNWDYTGKKDDYYYLSLTEEFLLLLLLLLELPAVRELALNDFELL